jgi:hypothetical protein
MAVYLDPWSAPEAWNIAVIAGIETPGGDVGGRVEVEFDRATEYDVKTGKGTKGATETLKGLPPAKGKLKAWVWTPAAMRAWNPILTILAFDPTKGGNVTPAAPAATPAAAASPASSFQIGAPGGSSGTPSIPSPDDTSGTKSSDTASNDNAQPALSSAYAIDFFAPAAADVGVTQILPPEKIGSWKQEGEGTGLWAREFELLEFVQAPAASVAVTPSGATDAPTGYTSAGSNENGGAPTPAPGSPQGAGGGAQSAWGGK